MAIKSTIFDTDPDAKPKPKPTYDDGTVGAFGFGVKNANGDFETLNDWRFTTGDRDIAQAVAQLYGGAPNETDSTSENFIEVLTTTDRIPVILADADSALDMDYKLWNGNKLVHHCDGSAFLSPEDKAGRPCGCPELFSERKAAAKDKIGPPPSIDIRFRLADDPELGLFRFHSAAWTMAVHMHEYDWELRQISGEAVADLYLEYVEFTPKKGPMRGKPVSYIAPKLENIRSLNSAVAEQA